MKHLSLMLTVMMVVRVNKDALEVSLETELILKYSVELVSPEPLCNWWF